MRPPFARPADYRSQPRRPIMALLTVLGGGAPDMLCSGAQAASPLSGMVPMYVLMSAFHSAPWLKLISTRVAKTSGYGIPRSQHREASAAVRSRVSGLVAAMEETDARDPRRPS